MLQFTKLANLYFGILTIMECYPPISDSGGVPVLGVPLAFVVSLSMLKDAYEDYLRHVQDNDENNRKVMIGTTFTKGYGKKKTTHKEFLKRRWKQGTVGKIIKVYENQSFPCDLLLLGSSAPKGICYVETKNLDGETNLKHKQAKKECWKIATTDQDVLTNFNDAVIECEKPNEWIYKFFGTLQLNSMSETIALDIDQVLLRGSSLRNTEWVYGVAIYTGHETKVMMNSANNKAKFSKIEKATGKYIIICILI